LQTISRMSKQSITFFAFYMPHQLFCIISISKQSLKPWYYWKIPTNLCWTTVVYGCIITGFMIVDLVVWYTTCWAIAHFCKLIYNTQSFGHAWIFWYSTGHNIFFASYWFFSNVLSSGSNFFNNTSNSVKLSSLQPNRPFKLNKLTPLTTLWKLCTQNTKVSLNHSLFSHSKMLVLAEIRPTLGRESCLLYDNLCLHRLT